MIAPALLVIGIAGKPRRCAYGRLRQQRGDVEATNWAGDPSSGEMLIPSATRHEALASGRWRMDVWSGHPPSK